jgi:carboxymethylenebutenolidase
MRVTDHVFRAGLAALLILTPASLALAESREVIVGVDGKMTATIISPSGTGPYPGVLLLHTSGGLRQADLDYGEKLAKDGYVVMVPAFLAAYGITGQSRRMTFTSYAEPIYADLITALNALESDPRVAGSKLGAIGFSNGGYFAMWLAATGKVRAAVSYYGALTGAGSDKELTRFQAVFSASSSPVLILHGRADDTVPVGVAERLASLIAAGGSSSEIHLYEGAGHSFERTGSGSDQTAADDAWQRTTSFFSKHLK